MTLTIRNLDEKVEQKLRLKAASHGRSMEAEAREILTRDVEGASLADSVPVATAHPHSICDSVRGIWKGRGTTDEMMRELRGDD